MLLVVPVAVAPVAAGLVAAAGTVICVPHLGHFTVRPANSDFTLSDVAHCGQRQSKSMALNLLNEAAKHFDEPNCHYRRLPQRFKRYATRRLRTQNASCREVLFENSRPTAAE
jgi:hypothetical protein